MPTPRRWFITGARRGFGRQLTEAALSRGDLVVATVRRPEDRGALVDLAPGRVWATHCDVRRPDEVTRAVEAAVSVMGGVDVVVNNAGYGVFGAVEEISESELRQQLEVNVAGVWNVVRAVLPTLRAQRSGHIVQMSSVAGLAGGAGSGAYNASKFALEGMSEALAIELKPLGIHVTLVCPGQFRTDFAASASVAARVLDVYANGASAQRRRLDTMNGVQPGDPARAIDAILALLDLPAPPVRLLLGADSIRRARTRTAWVAAEIEASVALGADTAFPGTPEGAGLPDFVAPTQPPVPKRRKASRAAPAVRRPVISVIGQSDPEPAIALAAEEVGRRLVDAGFRVATGGKGGVMAAVSKGARSSKRWQEGDVIGVLPGLDPAEANPWVDVVVPTGLNHARNVVLVAMADVVVAIGGGAGTLSEIAHAWQHDKPIVALAMGEGWAAILAGQAIDGRREDVVHAAETAEEVVRRVEGLVGQA